MLADDIIEAVIKVIALLEKIAKFITEFDTCTIFMQVRMDVEKVCD